MMESLLQLSMLDRASFYALALARRLVLASSKFLQAAHDRRTRSLAGDTRLAQPTHDTVTPVFTLSTGRSGTMTLAALIGQSPMAEAHHEPEPRLLELSYLTYVRRMDFGDRFVSHAIGAARDRRILGAHGNGRVYFESNNRLTLLADHLAIRYPRSRFLLVTRHPYDVVRSGMARGHYSGHPWDFARIRPRSQTSADSAWGEMSPLERCSWLWAATNEEAVAAAERLPPGRRFQLKAEDMFDGREEILRQLFSFVGVPVPSMKALGRILALKLNHQPAPEYPKASRWPLDERRAVDRIVGPLASRFGYPL